jgi:ABC-type uncharacterized transport system fused permease/ATPase subunit
MLDEVTSNMDEATEEKIYQLIEAHCTCYISIGHRSSIRKYHSQELQIPTPLYDGNTIITPAVRAHHQPLTPVPLSA